MALARGSFNNRRKKRTGVNPRVLIAGAAGALLCIAFIAVALHAMRAPSSAAVRTEPAVVQVFTTDILVPIETIQVGVAMQPSLFRKEAKPEEQVTGDMIRGFDELKGMYSRGVLFKGQPILKAALTNRQPVHVLTALLPKDYRAVALEVERPLLDNVDGWAQPGTDVDVVWITSVFGREVAAILAGPVRVLASNKATEWSPAKTATTQTDKLVTVTLLLSVRDAVRVSLAAMHGKISLGLRGLADKRPNETSRPLSTIIDEPIVKEESRGVLSVKVVNPDNRGAELRKYDQSGRRVVE
jgi:Flp pilus assembly protein CpaB